MVVESVSTRSPRKVEGDVSITEYGIIVLQGSKDLFIKIISKDTYERLNKLENFDTSFLEQDGHMQDSEILKTFMTVKDAMNWANESGSTIIGYFWGYLV